MKRTLWALNSICSSNRPLNRTLNRAVQTTLALMLVAGGFGSRADAQSVSCEGLFISAETRHQAQYDRFVRPGTFEGRLGMAGTAQFLQRLQRRLPAGNYDVLLNSHQRDTLMVSYSPNGHVSIRLASRPLVQSDSTGLRRDFPIALNMTFGISSRIQLLSDHRIAVSTTTVRGNEKSLAGLTRTDGSIEFNFEDGPAPLHLTFTETTSNWSVKRPEIRTTETLIRIDQRPAENRR